tara:strand:- start:3236 stop:3472 length:237 start_codon:yes stop_codon:yes gene_type:complete
MNKLLSSSLISIIYLIIKFLEMRFVSKENKPLKKLVLDALIVFIASIITSFIFEQFDITNILNKINTSPVILTNTPNF